MALSTATLDVSCLVPVSPRLRLLVHHHIPQYHIRAFPTCRSEKTVIYVATRFAAIVAHVLGPDWGMLLGEENGVIYRGIHDDWAEEDEKELAMRIIQVGGTVIDTTKPETHSFDMQPTDQFAAFSRTKKYVFGWPPQGGLWVLHLHGLLPLEYWQTPPYEYNINDPGIISAEELEEMEKEAADPYGYRSPVPIGAIDLSRLNKAATMQDYCSELSQFNATFYLDPSQSGEAKDSGLSDDDVLKTRWQGFTAWEAWLKRGTFEFTAGPLEMEHISEPVKTGCVVS